MLIVQNKRYVKKHVVGGAGLFDTVANFFKRLVGSNTARSLANAASRAAASDLGKSAISAAKNVGKELATSAISTARDVAIDKGKKLITTAVPKVLTPRNAEVIKKLTGLEPNTPVITQKSKDILTSLINSGAEKGIKSASTNINNLMMGQGISNPKAAIRIEDLVRQMNVMNGSGLRLA